MHKLDLPGWLLWWRLLLREIRMLECLNSGYPLRWIVMQ